MNEAMCNIMLYGGVTLAVIFAAVAVVIFVKLDIPKVIGDLTGSTAKKQIKEIREKGYESVQGSGASKKDAIKSKNSTGKIEVRDIKGGSTASEELAKKSKERYKQAVYEANRQESRADASYEKETKNGEEATDVLHDIEDYEEATDVLQDVENYEEATDVLHGSDDYEEATDVLHGSDDYEEATDVLHGPEDYEEATDILHGSDDYEEATDILSAEDDHEMATDVLTTEPEEEATDVLRDENTEEKQATFAAAGFSMLTDVVVTHSEETIGGKEI